jgi:hypothetical protein
MTAVNDLASMDHGPTAYVRIRRLGFAARVVGTFHTNKRLFVMVLTHQTSGTKQQRNDAKTINPLRGRLPARPASMIRRAWVDLHVCKLDSNFRT